MKKFWYITENIILTIIIIFSVLIIISKVSLFGLNPFVVKSGSMEPKIHTGSLVLTSKKPVYRVGDVITFKRMGQLATITHRIVKVSGEGLETKYIVKGDANNTADPEPVPIVNVVGKTLFTLPFLGYLIEFVKTLPGLIILIFIPAGIVIFRELLDINSEIRAINLHKLYGRRINLVIPMSERVAVPQKVDTIRGEKSHV